jgi:DNA-binding response OmpR family regulator
MKLTLIVDDDELARSVVDRFREHGHAVYYVGHGDRGPARALREQFDAVVVRSDASGMYGQQNHVSRLRMRLNASFTVDAIQTVRGVGYWLLAAN